MCNERATVITYKSPIPCPPPRLPASCLQGRLSTCNDETRYESAGSPCHIEFCMDDSMSSSSPALESLYIEPSNLLAADSQHSNEEKRRRTHLLLISIDNMLTSLVRWRRWSGRDGVSTAKETSGDWRAPGVSTGLSPSTDRCTGVW